jgi:plastocyanin
MRIRDAVVTIMLMGSAACGDSNGPGSPGNGGGPVGSVTVGSGIQFVSRHNGSVNPAVDTIAVGETVTWTWSGNLPHNVRSVGAPSFTSSPTLTGTGTYSVTFATPGVYQYDCVVHGAAMTGTVVVTGVSALSVAADPTGDTFDAAALSGISRRMASRRPPALLASVRHANVWR